MRERKRMNKTERENEKEKAINEESTNGRKAGYNNKTQKSPWIPLLIRSTVHRNNPRHRNVVTYNAPPCVSQQHPWLQWFTYLCCASGKREILFFIGLGCLSVEEHSPSAAIHSIYLHSCHWHAAASLQTADCSPFLSYSKALCTNTHMPPGMPFIHKYTQFIHTTTSLMELSALRFSHRNMPQICWKKKHFSSPRKT